MIFHAPDLIYIYIFDILRGLHGLRVDFPFTLPFVLQIWGWHTCRRCLPLADRRTRFHVYGSNIAFEVPGAPEMRRFEIPLTAATARPAWPATNTGSGPSPPVYGTRALATGGFPTRMPLGIHIQVLGSDKAPNFVLLGCNKKQVLGALPDPSTPK